MAATAGSMQAAMKFRSKVHEISPLRGQLRLSLLSPTQYSLRSTDVPIRFRNRPYYLQCQCSRIAGSSSYTAFVNLGTLHSAWSCKNSEGFTVTGRSGLAVAIISIIWGIFVRLSKCISQNKSHSNWRKGNIYQVAMSYVQPLLLCVGAIFLLRIYQVVFLFLGAIGAIIIIGKLWLVVPATEADKIVMQLVHFGISMSIALTFHRIASRLHRQTEKFMETNDDFDIRKMVIQEVVSIVYYSLRLISTLSVMDFFGFSITKWDNGSVSILVAFTLLGDESWKLMRRAWRANTLTFSKDDAPELTSKDAAAIRIPSAAAEGAILASPNSPYGISKQLNDIRRQTSANVVSEAKIKSLLASLDELREQISSLLDPCGQSHITEV